MPKTQDRLSLDDFIIPVYPQVPAGMNPDPSVDVVQFQFVVGGLPKRNEPTESSTPITTGWLDGFWISQAPGPLLAAILVGPGGGIELAPGRWAAWIRIVDNPTVPVQAVDQITIT